jgi:hypothetical protein
LLAICGSVFSFAAWKSQDGGLRMKRIAFVLNVLPLMAAAGLYVAGWIL